MAVEARLLNVFPTQFLGNREMMNSIDGNIYSSAGIGYGVAPLSATTTTETLLPMYGSSLTESFPVKADSGLTYALPVSRKRSRDSVINHSLLSFPMVHNQSSDLCGSFTFLGEDISSQIRQQQMEIDRLISQHTEKVRMEIEERRKRYSRRIMAAVEEGIIKKLKAKEEEIEKIGKLNWALEEKVKSLCIENQIWRDLAQTNEATANALRSNLEQVLAQVQDERRHRNGGTNYGELMDDAQSCCGSNFVQEDMEPRSNTLTTEKGSEIKLDKRDCDGGTNDCANNSGNSSKRRMCRNCGKEESCVLLLPCRHLCICTVCGSSIHTCPICKSTKNASLHVNL